MYKMGYLEGGNWVEHVYPAVYQLPKSQQELQHLVAAVPSGNPEVFGRLVESLAPPFHLLYVLHTPRGEGLPGRYQSRAISAVEFRGFLEQFSKYLSSDARFDLWAHSPTQAATVVWDRHNRIFGYGSLSCYEVVLQELGFSRGSVEIPAPHEHNYHAELDPQAALVLEAFEWSHTPLHEKDEQ